MLLSGANLTRLAAVVVGVSFLASACHDSDKSGLAGSGGTKHGAAGEAAAGTGNGVANSGAGVATTTAGATGTATGGAPSVSGCAPPIETEGFVDVAPTDPAIRFVGRVFRQQGWVSFAYPAVQIETQFEGDAIDMRLRDFGLSRPNSTNFYWIIVDGEATLLKVCDTSEVYPLARNLGPGWHTLKIVKRTESSLGGQGSTGRGDLLGLRVRTGTRLKPVVAPTRRMEFVGDSITCGYGDELSIDDPSDSPFTARNEDAWHAYGAVAARALAADYVAIASSGHGVIRNYEDFVGVLMPAMYEMPLPDDNSTPPWDHATYEPDVVVVNLGTNDFSPGVALEQFDAHRAKFRQAYTDFLARIRAVHASATIVAAVGPMLNDDFPEGYSAWTSVQADVSAAVDARRAAGDPDVNYFAFAPQQGPYGEDFHPTLATHQLMADALVPFISQLRGW